MKTPIKVMTIFGTRPEAIKMAPIILRMKRFPDRFQPITLVTGQHREMLQQVLRVFRIHPDFNLRIMQKNQTLSQITIRVIGRLDALLNRCRPDIILVHGDTTTTFSAAVSAFYHRIPLGHVEAGLRTWNKYSPYPEEMNRQLTDVLADLYFAPTPLSRHNLLLEHHDPHQIYVTGNTAIDALKQTVDPNYHHAVLNQIDPHHRIILLTMHRRENQGQPMRRTFRVIKRVLARHPDVEVIYPLHLSPAVRQVAHAEFDESPRVHLVQPLDVVDFHNIAARSYFIMTDSGGVQEEAPSLGKPVLVLRDRTERPEGVRAGTLKLVGTDPNRIEDGMNSLLDHPSVYRQMSEAKNPYGDGQAAQRILSVIDRKFAIEKR